MKFFERVVLIHIQSNMPHTLDPLLSVAEHGHVATWHVHFRCHCSCPTHLPLPPRGWRHLHQDSLYQLQLSHPSQSCPTVHTWTEPHTLWLALRHSDWQATWRDVCHHHNDTVQTWLYHLPQDNTIFNFADDTAMSGRTTGRDEATTKLVKKAH